MECDSKQDEQMLKRSLFAMLTRFLHKHLLSMIIQLSRIFDLLHATLHQGDPNWNRTVGLVVFSFIPSLK